MIPNIDKFVNRFKSVMDSLISFYKGEQKIKDEFGISDFDVADLRILFNKTGSQISQMHLKKVYDIIRNHHRAYEILNQTKSDYYDFAAWDIERDKIIMDKIVDNANKGYDVLKDKYEVS